MRKTILLSAAALIAAAPALAEDAPVPVPAPTEIVAQSPKADWKAISPDDLLVMDLAPDAKGKPRRVVIQLMPAPYGQGWSQNVRILAKAHWWDGLSIYRVQDNYVTQWGDPDGDDKAKARPLPAGLVEVSQQNYRSYFNFGAVRPAPTFLCDRSSSDVVGGCPEWTTNPPFKGLGSKDAYAPATGFYQGWPIAREDELSPPQPNHDLKGRRKGTIQTVKPMSWPVHCYGMVGVGRDMPPNTGTGAELYTVIGHAPRQLDRNIALIGRIIEGMEFMSSLPRGHGPLGFYDAALGDERVPILRIHPAAEVADLPAYEYLDTDSPSFAKYADARANRRDPFYLRPAGGVDVCNVPVPVRRVPAAK